VLDDDGLDIPEILRRVPKKKDSEGLDLLAADVEGARHD
jgi:hypothetical protein